MSFESHGLSYTRCSLLFTVVTLLAILMYSWFAAARPAVQISTQSIVVDEVERSYRLVEPHDFSKPAPVVFAFHGIGDSPASMAEYSQLERWASDHGFLLVFPAAINAMWRTVDVDSEGVDDNRDVRFFDAMMSGLSKQFAIDHRRIYLTGMSNGSSFVQLLASARSKDVAAVVACSGPRLKVLADAQHPFPILLIVGANDLGASNMESDLDYYRSAGHDARLIVVKRLGHEWSVAHNDEAVEFMLKRRLSR